MDAQNAQLTRLQRKDNGMTDENINFELSLKELEKIVVKLENPEISLDESIKLFEEGITIANSCSKQLESARQKIVTLTEAENEEHNND